MWPSGPFAVHLEDVGLANRSNRPASLEQALTTDLFGSRAALSGGFSRHRSASPAQKYRQNGGRPTG